MFQLVLLLPLLLFHKINFNFLCTFLIRTNYISNQWVRHVNYRVWSKFPRAKLARKCPGIPFRKVDNYALTFPSPRSLSRSPPIFIIYIRLGLQDYGTHSPVMGGGGGGGGGKRGRSTLTKLKRMTTATFVSRKQVSSI